MVEAICGVPREFKVLLLILSDGNMRGSTSHQQEPRELDSPPNLWTKTSAAWRTGYEKRPSRSFDLASECSRSASSGSCSLLWGRQLRAMHLGKLTLQTLTFHCVIRDRYPMDATVLKIHISSVCAGT